MQNDLFRRLSKDHRFWFCGVYLIILIVAAVCAPILTPYEYNDMDSSRRLAGPSSAHLMGTDEFGRDIFTRILYGARLTLIVSVGAVLVSSILGTLCGLLAGFYRGWVEQVIMRLMDIILCFPSILLAMFVMILLGPSTMNLIITIGVLYVPRFARVVYGVTLSAKQMEYVAASRVVGCSDLRILVKAILPNVMAPIFVQMSLSLGTAVITESGLSFLGLGPPPPMPSWGRIIEQSARFVRLSPWVLIWPSLAIALTILAFNILGDSLRDNLDPRLRY
ncbi:MAG TPA: ABC transporter permease [Firmicutes bacterium]|nr:ABC transporter permease [Bacillota bacterium]